MIKITKRWQLSIYLALAYRMFLVMALYTICRLVFYYYNSHLFQEATSKQLITILLGGIKFDISALCYLNAPFILLQAIPLTIRYHPRYQKIGYYLFIITNCLGLVANLADCLYYPYTLKRTTAEVFAQFSGEMRNPKLLLSIIQDSFSMLLVLVGLILLLIYLYNKVLVTKPLIKYPTLYYLCGSLLLLGITYGTIVGMRGGPRCTTRPIKPSNAGEFVTNPKEISLLLNTPFCIMQTLQAPTLKRAAYFPTQAAVDSIYKVTHYPNPSKPFKGQNVVIIILESWSREHVGTLNKDLEQGTYRGYTPFLDSLMEKSLVATKGFANGRKSIDAPPAIIASIPSIQTPFVLSVYSDNQFNGLGTLLRKKAYHTSFFHGSHNGSMGFSSFAKMAGIEHYFGKTEYDRESGTNAVLSSLSNPDFDGAWGIWDEEFFQFFARKLNEFPQPFFSTIFSVSSHHPFKIPKRYKGRFPLGPLPVHECVAYTDDALRKFFSKASSMPWFKNTLFVITADHATVAYHQKYKNSVGAFAIPIVFYHPGEDLAKRINAPAQQIDILPTVLGFMNYDLPFVAFGHNLLTITPKHFVVNFLDGHYQIFYNDYLLLFDGAMSTALFNRKKDALLQHNLISQSLPIQLKMEALSKAFIQQYHNRLIDNKLIIDQRP